MSNIPLSNIQELIERTLFENIRQEVVDKGYLPDITQFENSEVGVILYNEAVEEIMAKEGFVIDVFNENASFEHGIKKIPRIVINSGNFLPGDIGGDPLRFFEAQENGTFTAMILPPQTVSFFINIQLISNHIKQERILNSLLALAVPRRRYLKWYNNPDKSFFIRHLNYWDIDDESHGIIEKVHAYEVPDCWDRNNEVVQQNIAKINQITLNTLLAKYKDGVITSDTGKLIIT